MNLTDFNEFTNMSVYSTTDYDKFKHIEGNRDLDEKHVLELMKQIEKDGLQQPIMITPSGHVFDGQHRLEACRRLGVPVKWIFTDGEKSIEDIQNLNLIQKKWTDRDYLKSYVKRGSKSAERILSVMDKYEIPRMLVMKSAGKDVHTFDPDNIRSKKYKTRKVSDPFNDHTFSEINKLTAEEHLEYCTKMLDILRKHGNVTSKIKTLDAFIAIDKAEGFERDRFEHILETEGDKIPLTGFTRKMMLMRIAKIYNFRKRSNYMDFSFSSDGSLKKITCLAEDNRWN